MARYLVTGGAGFVGSHAVLALLDRGDEVVVLDDLSQGHRAAVPAAATLVQAPLADDAELKRVFANWRFDAVLHFAALSLVGESMKAPMHYMAENLGNSVRLIEAAVEAGCLRFVLSSTAALFGNPARIPIDEDCPVSPGNPYGESKLMVETALARAERIHGLRYAALRYSNAAGSDPQGRGQWRRPFREAGAGCDSAREWPHRAAQHRPSPPRRPRHPGGSERKTTCRDRLVTPLWRY